MSWSPNFPPGPLNPAGYTVSFLEKTTKPDDKGIFAMEMRTRFIRTEDREAVLAWFNEKDPHGFPILTLGEFQDFYQGLLSGKMRKKHIVINLVKSIFKEIKDGRSIVRGRKNAKEKI